MIIKIKNKEIRECLNIETPEFPKYATQILNLANQNSQGTRPKVVGQMSELIQQFRGKTVQEWEEWYLKKHPEAISNATKKILEMVKNLKISTDKIDQKMTKKWVKELVIIQTFLGLKFQEAVLKKIAGKLKTTYRLAAVNEESKGIDGYIGNTPVSIKPETYGTKSYLPEKIETKIIFYKKIKDGLEIDFSELLTR